MQLGFAHASVHEVIKEDLNRAALLRLPPGMRRGASASASELGTARRSPKRSECIRLYRPSHVLPRHGFAGAFFFCHPKCRIFTKPGREQIWPFASFPRSPRNIFICRLALSGKPPSWENLSLDGDEDRMKNHITPFVNKRGEKRVTAWPCAVVAPK